MANRKPVKRITKHFQLRVENPQDQHVLEVLNYARSQRREVTVIREAVSLYYALEQGNLEALFEKFPQYKAIKEGGGGGDDRIDKIEQMLEILVQQKNTGGYLMQPTPPTTGKQIAAPTFSMPKFEEMDNEPTLVLSKNKSSAASLNFMQSLGGIQ